MTELNMVEAVSLALEESLSEDQGVVLLGEDIGLNGGVFRATEGLQEKFGKERVIDTPLAETAIAGVAIGLASQGFKPVAEIQFMGFIYSTMDQVINHASRLRTRTRGRLSCPMVLRAPFGGGIHAPEHHSESMEAIFAHVPGLRVVIPSSPARAYQLLKQSIQDPDPVIFLEPKRAYRAFREDIAQAPAMELDKCIIENEGSDLTIVSWGAMMQECRAALAGLQDRGIQAELIDVATLKPLDSDTISASVKKTGRLLVVHEAPMTGGFAGEIITRVSRDAFFSLLAPPARVTGFDTVMPLPKMEHYYMPGVERIVRAAQELVEYS